MNTTKNPPKAFEATNEVTEEFESIHKEVKGWPQLNPYEALMLIQLIAGKVRKGVTS